MNKIYCFCLKILSCVCPYQSGETARSQTDSLLALYLCAVVVSLSLYFCANVTIPWYMCVCVLVFVVPCVFAGWLAGHWVGIRGWLVWKGPHWHVAATKCGVVVRDDDVSWRVSQLPPLMSHGVITRAFSVQIIWLFVPETSSLVHEKAVRRLRQERTGLSHEQTGGW